MRLKQNWNKKFRQKQFYKKISNKFEDKDEEIKYSKLKKEWVLKNFWGEHNLLTEGFSEYKVPWE